jgi:hypothetical protein
MSATYEAAVKTGVCCAAIFSVVKQSQRIETLTAPLIR